MFGGVQYARYEAMFAGLTSNKRQYRVPCLIIAPLRPGDGSGLLLFDWLVRSRLGGRADPETASPAEWKPFLRALFVAGINWCDGVTPPPGIWLGAPNDASIARDAKGNALVRYVGGLPLNTDAYRLPEVAVGEHQYIPLDPSYNDGTFLGFFRMIGGGHVDLTDSFTDHTQYVSDVTFYALGLEAGGYLLESDAHAIIQRASDSDIGR